MSLIQSLTNSNETEFTGKNYNEIIKASKNSQLWSVSGRYYPDYSDSSITLTTEEN